jgi:hypothetical protein
MAAHLNAIVLTGFALACAPWDGARAALSCSVPGPNQVILTPQDGAQESQILESVTRPGANIPYFQSLGSPLAARSGYGYLLLSYSPLVDVDPIIWKLQALPGIRHAERNAYLCLATPAVLFTAPPAEVYELFNKRWGTYYYLTTDAEFRQLKREARLPDTDWEWTDESFLAWATLSSTGISYNNGCDGRVPVHRLEHRGADGYITHYYTTDLQTCGYAKSELGMQSRGQPFSAGAPRLDHPDDPCLSSKPIYRLYNNREAEGRPNHRYTPNLALANQLVTQGWTNEGVALCTK